MGIENGRDGCVDGLISIYKKKPKYFAEFIRENRILKERNEEQEEYIIELEYMPGGVGYEESKSHFESLVGSERTKVLSEALDIESHSISNGQF
jgi:hypothetical protein